MSTPKFPNLFGGKVIIATKGLPCTAKSRIAKEVGEWAKCPVFYMANSLNALSIEKGYTSREFMPAEEEDHRIHRLAFDALCLSARRFLHRLERWSRCVVIKSRLFSTFELDRLIHLSREICDKNRPTIILIIECHVKNEHRLCKRLEFIARFTRDEDKEWYKAWSTLDFEKARDDWLRTNDGHNPNYWDLYLRNLINADEKHPTRLIRLVLDPFDDLGMGQFFNNSVYRDINLPNAFQDAICHLLMPRDSSTADQLEEEVRSIGEEIIRGRYEVVQFRKLQRYLAEKEIQRVETSGKKNKYLCPTSRPGKCCVFKTFMAGERFVGEVRDDDDGFKCGVCDEPVISEGYTCYFCILTLHKSCAEEQDIVFPDDFIRDSSLRWHPRIIYGYSLTKYACKSCKEGGKGFSKTCDGCIFQSHLKVRRFPTIIKHDSHREHFLSLQVDKSSFDYSCKACGFLGGKYGCYVCGLWYCVVCVLRPGKVAHTHGGHEHALELVYSRDEKELEEDYWCSKCHRDMDPDYWFYSCTNCPFYEAHPDCIMPVSTF